MKMAARMQLAESGAVAPNHPGFHCISFGLQWQKKIPRSFKNDQGIFNFPVLVLPAPCPLKGPFV